MNSFRSFAVWLLDLFIREPRLMRKYYREHTDSIRQTANVRNIFMADGRTAHGGMFDRLKGLISVYAVSKIHNKNFKIQFSNPFRLEDYLEPNEYDWRIDDSEIIYSYPKSRPLFLYGECYSPRRLMKNRHQEAHFYYGYDSLKEINERYSTDFDWGKLYRELFRPTERLQQYINHYKTEIGNNYMAIHTRFLNLLGDKVETDSNPTLPAEQQKELKEKIGKVVLDLIEAQGEDSRALLASDSSNFISYMRGLSDRIYVIPGEIRHIDTASHTDDSEVIKMFLDYYLISSAKKVYNIVADGMWPSAFPEYAAKIGNTAFERIVL